MILQIGDNIGGYIIEQLLGYGGFGEVYKVVNPMVNKPFALKILHPSVKQLDASIVFKFENEIKILFELDHPKIVRPNHAGKHHDLPYFVMEYLPLSLADVIGDVDEQRKNVWRTQNIFREEEVKKTLSLEQTMTVARQLIECLSFIHSKNLIHRDLKPSNILLKDKDSLDLKLCDFGIAKMLGENFSSFSTKGILGSNYYSAPEVLQGMKDVDERADVFSLGVILYRLLTGNVPMGGMPAQLDALIPDLSVNISQAIMNAMWGPVDMRIKNVGEFKGMLFRKPKEKKVVDENETRQILTEIQEPKKKKEKVSKKELPPKAVGKDGAPMVLIPAGEFLMGSDDGDDNERPVHPVYLDTFYMDVYQVTNERYAKFLNEYGKETDSAGHELINIDNKSCLIEKSGRTYRPRSGYENHPVNCVSWYGAVAYAEYYDKRLPTEAEWEKAARGGLEGKKYPWGDESPEGRANFKSGGTKPIGSFAPNGYGLYDMAGNAWEWCSDWYDKNYYKGSPRENPTGPSSGKYRVCRGGSWDYYPYGLRAAYRGWGDPSYGYGARGFRCCVSSPSFLDQK